MKANFFIVGAPKCGTTAMSEYLRTHPQIFMSTPKEPSYFASDLPGLRYVDDLAEYERLFSRATADQCIIGEASPSYLFSAVAIENIAAYNPQARLLVMLRNPVEMLPSYHAQLCYSSFEDVTDLERAWDLQEQRRQGRLIPARCREARVLQYAAVASFPQQLERAWRHFPRSQTLVILYDDLVRDLPAVYGQVLDFLGVQDDGRREFPVVNRRKAARLAVLNRLLHTPPAWARRWMARLSGSPLHDRLVAVYASILRANTRPSESQGLDPAFRRRLVDFYAADIARLEQILGRQLDDWQG